ncbi:MAG: alkaline phosphatase D family protein [Myxococcota bacterium]
MRLTRRRLLAGASLAGFGSRFAWADRPRFSDHPFKLGVASGSPRPDGFVLWTRLAPEPLHDGGAPDRIVPVSWELAEDPGFRRRVGQGSFAAVPELGHSVHAEVRGLRPGRSYFYRFIAGSEVSAVGRTRTLPALNAAPDRLKLAYGSCQHFEQGWFAAHRHLLEEDLDLMVFLGDYIYESSWGERLVRLHSGLGEVCRSLTSYRNRHAQYKLDLDLQALHGAVPWLLTWDDHEVVNDYAKDRSERLDPNFIERRQAAYQAFWEHMPLRMDQRPRRGRMKMYGSVPFGRLARIHMLDGRQYKSPQACPRPGLGGGHFTEHCPGLEAEGRSFLGADQETWLHRALGEERADWSLLAQQTLLAPLDRKPGPGNRLWTDGWDGYPAARRRLLASLGQPSVRNAFVMGGDIHCCVAADLKSDRGPVVASEVCGTSIASQGPTNDQMAALRPDNPHVHLAHSQRGYVRLDIRPGRLEARLRVLDDEKERDSGVRTLTEFSVEEGRAGLQR